MRFTLRQLEYFVAVSEAGSITEAARRVHGSQPTLSAAVSGLERSLGVQLFVRHHAQGVSLTPAGRRFQLQARTLLRQAAEMERFAAELGERVSGQLDLGCLVTLAPLAAPRLCREFEEAHPDARVGLLEAGQAELLDALRDGRSASPSPTTWSWVRSCASSRWPTFRRRPCCRPATGWRRPRRSGSTSWRPSR